MSRYADLAETLYGHGAAAAKIHTEEIDGKTYSDKKLIQVWPDPLPPAKPSAEKINVMTLTALSELIDAGFEGMERDNILITVGDANNVNIIGKVSNEYGIRKLVAKAATPAYTGFEFGAYMDHEDFCIALQQHFVAPKTGLDNSDFGYVTRVSQTITEEAVVTSANDGISQSVGLKRSIKSGLADQHDLRRVVNLAPYRTFREVEQPFSDFLFRAQSQGDGKIPKLALFETDGGAWVHEAMANIKAFLEVRCKDVPVIS